MGDADAKPHADLMDRVYRHQRHIYDLTRKYYLLGRDRLIADLDPPPGGYVLELGCGTGRNLIAAARRYPEARFAGVDISAEMLETARAGIARAGFADRIQVAQGDATGCDLSVMFGHDRYDRVFVSYALSMIPPWREVVSFALRATEAAGSVHIVDFGQQERLPAWFHRVLKRWLASFHVHPPADLFAVIQAEAGAVGATVETAELYRDYARAARIILPRG